MPQKEEEDEERKKEKEKEGRGGEEEKEGEGRGPTNSGLRQGWRCGGEAEAEVELRRGRRGDGAAARTARRRGRRGDEDVGRTSTPAPSLLLLLSSNSTQISTHEIRAPTHFSISYDMTKKGT
ncbi:unnamed protein product [Camellia sinensis]